MRRRGGVGDAVGSGVTSAATTMGRERVSVSDPARALDPVV